MYNFFLSIVRVKLGGYIGRESDAPPGMISIWKGWTRFKEMVEDYKIISGQSDG